MTLTLDEVNRIRFPMARRQNEGYRAGEVDDFVDNVVATFTALNSEIERQKAQIEALKADQGTQGDSGAQAALTEENERLRREIEQLRQQASQQGAATNAGPELDELRRVNADLQQRVGQAESQAAQLRAQVSSQGQGGEGQVQNIVVTTSAEASSSAIRLVSLATEQAERVIGDADAEAAATRAEAERVAKETTAAAESKAGEIRGNAESEATRMVSEAKSKAEQVEVDARARREELFTNLESERDDFARKIDQLKTWESSYRSGIADYLRSQVEAVTSDSLQPGEVPSLAAHERTSSPTPRLDALLANRGDAQQTGQAG